MNNEFGYIDKEPFKTIKEDKQDITILNQKDDNFELKVTGTEKYDTFESFVNGPGKLMSSKLYYGVNSKLNPITFFNAYIKTNNFNSISSTVIISKMYAVGRQTDKSIKHITPKTKLRKFDYYNDAILYYFLNNPMTIKRKGIRKEIFIKAKTKKPKKLFSMSYNNDNEISVYLIHSFNPNGNVYDFSIKPKTYLQIKFKKGVLIDDVLQISSRIDSTLHMCLLSNSRNYIVTLYDYTGNSYNFYNYIQKKYEMKKPPIYNVSKNNNDSTLTFKKLLSLFVSIDFENSNTYLPFINFNKNIDYHEMEFLQYYKVLEVIDCEKQKRKSRDKDPRFLKKYLRKYTKLKNYFFKGVSVGILENEIRALRNYYSHEGFYVEELPVPTEDPDYYKKIDKQWLYDVKRLVKIIAYNEIYDKANVAIDELELTSHLY